MGYMDSINLGGISAAGSGGAASAFNPAAALGGLALEAGSAWYANRTAEKRQHEAMNQQQYLMANRYQMQTKDLMAAGLNPMLAVNQGAPMPNAPSQAQTTKPELMQAMASTQLASAQAANIRQQTENLKLESQNIQNTAAQWPTSMQKLGKEIDEIEQRIKSGQASQHDTEQLAKLHKVQEQLGQQEYDTKRPEQIASGLDAATWAAMVSRTLKPLIDALNSATRR